MKLALIGHGIAHSQSPTLYRRLIGPHVQYDLIDVPLQKDPPSLEELKHEYQGINITTPFKSYYTNQVKIYDQASLEIGAINTLVFDINQDVFGINTDIIAVEKILMRFKLSFETWQVLLLGDGVMASLTRYLCQLHEIPCVSLTRENHGDLTFTNLKKFHRPNSQNVIINSCSRTFHFKGDCQGNEIFWDYNYHMPYQSEMVRKFKQYYDGLELLELQAQAAVAFWGQYTR